MVREIILITINPLESSVLQEYLKRLFIKQFLDFFNSNKLLSTKQWQFRNLNSTVLALLNSFNNWYINIDKGDTNGVSFLDIKKVFDTTDHSISEDSLFSSSHI